MVRCPIPSSFSSVTAGLGDDDVRKVMGHQAKLKPVSARALINVGKWTDACLALRCKVMSITTSCTLP